MTTIEEIVRIRHKHLKTISSKLIFLMIRNRADGEGWSTISIADFSHETGMPLKSITRVLKRLQSLGLIELNPEKAKPNSTNQYRIIDL